MQIISTKLSFPTLRSRLVRRQRLNQKLDRGAECGFVLVSAPAGYGKTTLLASWLNHLDLPSVWLSLDEEDNDPIRFLGYLFAALRKIEPSLGKDFEISLQSVPLPAVEILFTPLLNDLARVASLFWLVLDDYHIIQDQSVHQAVSFLLRHRPASLHLAIASRADPPFTLSNLRARSQMVELRLADLRFTRQEIAEFLRQVMDLSLSEADLDSLETSTEGWIAGLQMAGLTLQGRASPSDFIDSFSGENRYILDFLFDEVFQRQSKEIQMFLLQTSILERLCGPLCDRVTMLEDSQAVLDELERNNLFLIALDDQRHWYRYHTLFADLLKSRLNKTMPGESVHLHQRASAWYAEKQDLEGAITHAFAAQDFDCAANYIDQIAQNLDMQNKQAVLSQWVKRLPREILAAHPWLCVFRAWGEYWTGNRGAEEVWLQEAERSIERAYAEGHPEREHILGHVAVVRAHTALIEENIPRTLEMGQKAWLLLPEGDEMRFEAAVALGGAYWGLGDVHKSEQAFGLARAAVPRLRFTSMGVGPAGYVGIQQVKQGRLEDTIATFQDALHMATMPDGTETPIAGFPLVRLGDVWRERNNLQLASLYFNRGIDRCMRFNQPDVLADAYGCLGHFKLASGDLDGAREALQRADQISKQTKIDTWILCRLEELRLKIWLEEGDLAAVNRWILNSGLTVDGPLSYSRDLHHQNLARAMVTLAASNRSRSSYEQAATLLTRLRAAAEQAGWVHEEIKILVLQAVNERTFGSGESALASLARAVWLAQPGCYVRVFVDEGEVLLDLLTSLNRILQTGQVAALEKLGLNFQEEQVSSLEEYVSMLISAFASLDKQVGRTRGDRALSPVPLEVMVEPLSAREMDVLQLLSQGCPDKKIAGTLMIAPETVHKHLKNIYGKLGVHSRTEAIARARELSLL